MINIFSIKFFKGRLKILKILCLFTIVTFLFLSVFNIFLPGHSAKHMNMSPSSLTKYLNSLAKPTTENSPVRYCGGKYIKHNIPIIYVITPTYYRMTQRADLTRLANTLRWIQKLHWIIVEDWDVINLDVYEILNSSTISFTYLAQKRRNTTKKYIKGADQRNMALDWIMVHHNRQNEAVFYFVDDDNSYSLEIFEQLRCTKKLSMWPVGLSGGRAYETPIVRNGKVTHFAAWMTKRRKFPMDMAGFALNVRVLWKYHPMRFNTTSAVGFQETKFLEICCTLNDIEPLADNCTKVLVWHTKTVVPQLVNFDDRIRV